MHIYRQTYKMSENFPVHVNQTWVVRERNEIVEHWSVVHVGKTTFTAQIEELRAPDLS